MRVVPFVIACSCAGGGCVADPDPSDSNGDECDAQDIPSEYDVRIGTDPDPAVAGEAATFQVSVLDGNGCPVEDLQQSHTRMIHSVFVSADLEDFQHLHQEDFEDITAEDLATATFHFPITFPTSGDHHVIEDFALSNLARTRFLADRAAQGRPIPEWSGFARAPADAMRMFLNGIDERYGSVRGYARDELGLSADELDALKARLLN